MSDPFVELIRPHLGMAHRLALGMLRDIHEAEDAVQEAIVKAWRVRDRFRSEASVRPWFLTIVANQCRQQRRNRWWSVVKLSELPPAPVADPASKDITDLHQALARLPHRQRLLLVRRC